MNDKAAFVLVAAEMDKAWSRFGDGSMAGAEMSRTERFAVLSEEVGEVAAEVVKAQRNRSQEPDKHGPEDTEALIHELIQVAACALMWVGAEASGNRVAKREELPLEDSGIS